MPHSIVMTPKHEPLSRVPNHTDIPGLERWLLLDADTQRDSILVAMHQIHAQVSEEVQRGAHYAHEDVHDYDEINILIPAANQPMVYRYMLDGYESRVHGPTTVYIPAGTRHSAEVVRGEGTFICISLKPKA